MLSKLLQERTLSQMEKEWEEADYLLSYHTDELVIKGAENIGMVSQWVKTVNVETANFFFERGAAFATIAHEGLAFLGV